MDVPFLIAASSAKIGDVRIRRHLLLLFALLLAGAPLLACLPTASMTDAEMECCKKMAGNCDMGGGVTGTGDHSCCKNTISVSHSTAAVIQRQAQTAPLAIAVSVFVHYAGARTSCELVRYNLPSISISPPGSLAILRI